MPPEFDIELPCSFGKARIKGHWLEPLAIIYLTVAGHSTVGDMPRRDFDKWVKDKTPDEQVQLIQDKLVDMYHEWFSYAEWSVCKDLERVEVPARRPRKR